MEDMSEQMPAILYAGIAVGCVLGCRSYVVTFSTPQNKTQQCPKIHVQNIKGEVLENTRFIFVRSPNLSYSKSSPQFPKLFRVSIYATVAES
jgi:hypothetical protein